MAAHSSTLAWKILWMEEPGRLQPMGSLRVGHDWATSLSLFTFMHWRRKRQPTPVFLPGESQGWEPGGLPSMGLHRVGHDWSNLSAAAAILPDSWKTLKECAVKTSVLLLSHTLDLDPCMGTLLEHLFSWRINLGGCSAPLPWCSFPDFYVFMVSLIKF